MVWIKVGDWVWNPYMKSLASTNVRMNERLVEMFEDQLQEEPIDIIEDAKKDLIDDTPEAYISRKIELKKENKKSQKATDYSTSADEVDLWRRAYCR